MESKGAGPRTRARGFPCGARPRTRPPAPPQGTIVASYFPPGKGDENGAPLDAVWPALMAAADDAGITVAPHFEVRALSEGGDSAVPVAHLICLLRRYHQRLCCVQLMCPCAPTPSAAIRRAHRGERRRGHQNVPQAGDKPSFVEAAPDTAPKAPSLV